ncbi:DUF2283 domain-containing protein [Corynebacterium casei]|uniref:DUF2283 domain-containing protein n=1 Tax=Corynebacterium casei TaxID=160386 RepID=UPI003FD30251
MSLDFSANAAYVQLTDHEVEETKIVDESLFVDLDDQGAAIGVEVLGLKDAYSLKHLLSDAHLTASHLETVAQALERIAEIAAGADPQRKEYIEIDLA